MVEPSELLTIPSVVREAARRYGDIEAVVDGDTRLTFSEFEAAVDEVAAALIATGVEPGDRVAIWAPNSARWLTIAHAIYASGAVCVSLNTRYKSEEAGHVLRTSGARLLFTVTDFLETDRVAMLDGIGGLDDLAEIVVASGPSSGEATDWNAFLGRAERCDPISVSERERGIGPDDASDIIFTSGTTGAPKGAVLGHHASVRTYQAWSASVGLRHGDRSLVVYPFFHTAGLKSGALSALIAGVTIVPEPVFDVPTIMRRVTDERITILPGPPTVFQSILHHPDFDSFDLSSLRLSVTGAAVVPVEVIRQMKEDLGIATVVTGYGLTETTGTVSMCRHDDSLEVIATTVGRPLPGVEIRIVDDDGTILPDGSPGEIVVRGFNVMHRYFNDEAATNATIDAEGWLRTGDIGLVGDDGNLRITDRKKDMFIVGGFNAYPAEIEAMMLLHDDIVQVAVVGVPDERLGEVGVAFVVPRDGSVIDSDGIVAWCRDHMANFKVPRAVHLLENLPVNASGKVLKPALRTAYLTDAATTSNDDRPDAGAPPTGG